MNITKEQFMREIQQRRKQREREKNEAIYRYYDRRHAKHLRRRARA